MLPGEHERFAVVLLAKLKEIARVEAKAPAFAIGSTSDVFTVQGEQAQAGTPQASSSGLANYSRDSIQGAISNVPGIQQDSFANVIVRGGKVQDTVYDYDSVPVPQGLIAEPGGNIVGAQLGTAGVGSETVTLGGYNDVSQNALGGVVNEVPLTGTYPGAATLELAGWNRRAAWRDQVYRTGGDARPALALCALRNERQRVFCLRRRPHVLSCRDRHVWSRLSDASTVCDRR